MRGSTVGPRFHLSNARKDVQRETNHISIKVGLKPALTCLHIQIYIGRKTSVNTLLKKQNKLFI